MPEKEEFVPTIDISPMFGNDQEAKLNVAKKIDAAFRSSGFFYASNHGVDLSDLYKTATEFFKEATDEDKFKIGVSAWNPDNVKQKKNGYRPPKTDRPVELFRYSSPSVTSNHPMMKNNMPFYEVNAWPDEDKHPGFKDCQENYFNACYNVAKFLLRAIALALGREEYYFDQYFRKEDNLSQVQIIHYLYSDDDSTVPVAPDGTKMSLASHVDEGFLTVLAQTNVQNLQVLTDDGYVDIPASEENLLINGAGYMEHVTNGYYKSIIHRVVHDNCERLSIPFFGNLGFNDAVPPVAPIKMEKENEPLSFGNYLHETKRQKKAKQGLQ